jgi:hypothetical protein
MRIIAYTDDGQMVMIYEAGEHKGVKQACYPAKRDVAAVGYALAEALMFLSPTEYKEYFADHETVSDAMKGFYGR